MDEQVMSEDDYINGNFMILERFRDFENQEGNLAVKIKFEKPIEEKLFLCWMPCYKKQIHFDRNLSVQVT